MNETTNHIPWEDQFRQAPDLSTTSCYTMIVCAHPVHGVETFYLGLDDFQAAIRSLITPYWINNYTVTMIPMD